MPAARRTEPPDPDFDPPPGPPVRLRDFDPLEYQRVLVNPFLAVLALIAFAELTRRLLVGPFPPLAPLAALIVLPGLPYLVQYHCLDCGQTGMYVRRAHHACAGIFNRWQTGRHGRFPLPAARTQLIVWLYILGAAWILRIALGF